MGGRSLPASFPEADSPPPPSPVRTGLAGDADGAAPSLGRIIGALNLALPGGRREKPETRCSRASLEPKERDAAP